MVERGKNGLFYSALLVLYIDRKNLSSTGTGIVIFDVATRAAALYTS